jgi:2-polyprenyl-3-methyl-5-hydroxy-6-metoxy-1,4-benzoquinol methylase
VWLGSLCAVPLYDFPIDVESTTHAPAVIYRMVGSGHRVLDVGGATGALGRALTAAGNTVTVLDQQPEAVAMAADGNHRALVVDVETTALNEMFGDERFDVVVLADVLEHMRDPAPVLRAVTTLLAADGRIIISIPNITHIDARLMLLEGRWDLRETGLLDATHLRWFTWSTLMQLVHDAGLAVGDVRRVIREPGATNLGVDLARHDHALIERIATDPDAITYQFVISCHVGRPATVPAPVVTTTHGLVGTALPGSRRSTAERAARRALASARRAAGGVRRRWRARR